MIDNSRPYSITRLGESLWEIAGMRFSDVPTASYHCSVLDEERGYEWEIYTPSDCEEGLKALKVGESMKVIYPEDDE